MVRNKISYEDLRKAREIRYDLNERINYLIDNKVVLYTDTIEYTVVDFVVADNMLENCVECKVIIDVINSTVYNVQETLSLMSIDELLPTKRGEK